MQINLNIKVKLSIELYVLFSVKLNCKYITKFYRFFQLKIKFKIKVIVLGKKYKIVFYAFSAEYMQNQILLRKTSKFKK